MRITRIDTHPIGVGWKNWLFVQVHTDEGLTGLGEATLNGFIKATEAVVHELSHLIIGADPWRVKQVAATLLERVSLDGGHLHRTAIAGIEVACWDILGKSLGVPVHQLLGGAVCESVEAYANGWYRTERTPEAFAEAARAATARGFYALKFDPLGTTQGFFQRGPLALSRDIIAAVRTAVGSEGSCSSTSTRDWYPPRRSALGGAEDADSAGGVLDDGQDVHPGPGQGYGFEEVGGEDGFGLGAEEHCPALCGPVGCRVDAGIVEDLTYCGRGDVDFQTSSSPWMRLYPHELFSWARRSTSARMDRTVCGRPTRFGRETWA